MDEINQEILTKYQQILELQEQGMYEKAIPIAIQVRDLTRQRYGEDDPVYYAKIIGHLASLYQEIGDYFKAEPLYQESLKIIRKNPQEEDEPYFINILNNLGGLKQAINKYEEAESLFKQALDLQSKIDKNHANYALFLNNLGLLYYEMGYYASAEPLYLQAIEIMKKDTREGGHPTFPSTLNNLALVYVSIGSFDSAEQLYLEALQKMRNNLILNDLKNYATTLNSLAQLYMMRGKYSAAEPYILESMKIFREKSNKHAGYADSLTSLAILYQSIGKYIEAESLYLQINEIRLAALGEHDPGYAGGLNNLARIYQLKCNYNEAEPLYRKALKIIQESLGCEHPHYAVGLTNLAILYLTTGRLTEAIKQMQEVLEIKTRIMGQIFTISSESQRMAYLITLQSSLYIFLSMFIQDMNYSPEDKQTCLDMVLRRKAIGAESLTVQRNAIMGGHYPSLKPKLQKLMTLRCQIAQKTLAGPSAEGPVPHHKLLLKWTTWKELLEKELASKIPEMNIEQNLHTVDRKTLAQALPTESVLIEFIRFLEYDFKPKLELSKKEWSTAHFLAFVLPAGKPDEVKIVNLGEAKPIERLIAGFCSSFSDGDRNLTVEGPFSELNSNDGYDLRRTVFDPLIPALCGCARLFIAPDGDLARLPFEILPADNGRRLIDDYHFSYLSVGRDILRFGAVIPKQTNSPLVIANPNFDLGLKDKINSDDKIKQNGHQSQVINRKVIHFSPLPGSHIEGKNIAALLGVQPWLKNKALEGKLKASPSPRILHIASHGFFLENQKHDPNQEHFEMMSPFNRLSFGLENPMLRSGLALAGANTWLQGKPLPPEAEDAILNAEDVSGLDLSGTELVVLSACETGLGDIQVGEGVFGLRRAFVLAGAKTLVMSLWKVPDQQTQELMEDFYHRILSGKDRASALREAQLAMKDKYPDPLYWGAFICQGDPGPIRLA